MRILTALLFLFSFGGSALAGGHSYQPGRILSFDTAQHRKGNHAVKDEVVYQVQVGSVVYKVTNHSQKHPFAVGADVECRMDSKHLYIEKPKGGEVKLDIVGEASSSQ